MDILLIGNGFDQAHGLPTSYRDFLEFSQQVERIYTLYPGTTQQIYEDGFSKDWELHDALKKVLCDAFEKRKTLIRPPEDAVDAQDPEVKRMYLVNEMHGCLQNNPWLKYFVIRSKSTGRNWIDFEAEIKRVVQQLDDRGARSQGFIAIESLECGKDDIGVLFREVQRKLDHRFQKRALSADQFTVVLHTELERLIRALDIYIAGFVQEIPVERKNPNIEQLKPDCVLSFNYSNTYERVYGAGRTITYDYIHGKADLSRNERTCQLVLGIQEYLDDDRKNQDLLFLPFKKYFQRIYKSTDNTYLTWARQFREEEAFYQHNVQLFQAGEPILRPTVPSGRREITSLSSIPHEIHTIHIFGHSLDVTDGEVLRQLICNDNVQTIIFYHRRDEDDKSSLAKKIRNLIRIIGRDELIRRTGGPSQTIWFEPQALPDGDVQAQS